MAGRIEHMINTIIKERSKGNSTIASTTRTKLMLKGVNPDKYHSTSPDDPAVIARLQAIGAEMGITL